MPPQALGAGVAGRRRVRQATRPTSPTNRTAASTNATAARSPGAGKSHGRHQGRRAAQSGGDRSVAQARADEALIEMLAMGLVPALSPRDPAGQGPHRVGKKEPEAGGGEEHGGPPRLRRRQKRQGREGKAHEPAAGIPQEDAGGRPVVDEEPQARPRERDAGQRGQGIEAEERDPEPGDDRLESGQTVDAVEEVVEVDHADDPEHGQRHPQPAEGHVQGRGQRQAVDAARETRRTPRPGRPESRVA